MLKEDVLLVVKRLKLRKTQKSSLDLGHYEELEVCREGLKGEDHLRLRVNVSLDFFFLL